MQITSYILEAFKCYILDIPPETGGIIGSKDGTVITELVMDKPNPVDGWCCSYSPNVDFLNECIDLWETKGIRFMGIFHTHFADVDTLSCADKGYIESIMRAMPAQVPYLYFPLYLLPSRKLVCYCANLQDGVLQIAQEPCQVVTLCDENSPSTKQ